jgi:hypothetical protein
MTRLRIASVHYNDIQHMLPACGSEDEPLDTITLTGIPKTVSIVRRIRHIV